MCSETPVHLSAENNGRQKKQSEKVLCRKKCEPGHSGVPARAALKMIKKCKLKDSRCI
jgi:hypothetical protein